MEDQQTEAVQPQEGQGDGGDSPYSQYLEQIPEEARSAATEAFKAWDGDVTRRFQEASEFKKSWEPYQQAGINQYDPQALAEHLQMLQDPAAIVEWARGIAQQNGIQLAPEQQPAQPEPDYTGYQDPAQQLEQLLEQRLAPLMQKFEQYDQRTQQQQEQAALDGAQAYIDGQLDELASKHGDLFNREMVERMAQKYVDDPLNAIPKAWEEWQKIVNGIEKQALQPKVNAPDPAEGGGIPDMNREKIGSLQDPKLANIARQYLRNNASA